MLCRLAAGRVAVSLIVGALTAALCVSYLSSAQGEEIKGLQVPDVVSPYITKPSAVPTSWVFKKKGVLHLKSATGQWIRFKDNPEEGGEFRFYTFRGFIRSIDSYLVYLTYYEEYSALLVHRNGRKVLELDDLPHFSPNGRSFCTTVHDEHAGGLRRAQIFDIQRGTVKLKASFDRDEPESKDFERVLPSFKGEWGFGDARWTNNSDLRLRVLGESGEVIGELSALRHKGRWILVRRR